MKIENYFLISKQFIKTKDNFVKNPFYYFFCETAASDEVILSIANSCANLKTAPFHLLAAIKYLYKKRNPTSDYFFIKDPGKDNYNNIYLKIREFCYKEKSSLTQLIKQTNVITNECGRSAYLIASLFRINKFFPLKNIDIIELGSSIGLNLLFKEYLFCFIDEAGEKRFFGKKNSMIIIETSVFDGFFNRIKPFSLNNDFVIHQALGVDNTLMEFNKINSLDWQKALVWPGQYKRIERLELAFKIYKKLSPQIIDIEIEEYLKKIENDCHLENTLVFFSSYVFKQMESRRSQITKILSRLSKKRNIINIVVDYIQNGKSAIYIYIFMNGKIFYKEKFGHCDSHGDAITKK